MANNKIQVKRTSTAGRTPNTTNSGNTQYIAAGEFALNMTDQILYTSDGTNLIEVGANNTTARITNSLTIDNSKSLRFKTVNSSAQAYFVQQNDDNFVFYSTNTAYGTRAIWSIYANSITSNLQIQIPLQLNSGLIANNSTGTAGQVLTTNGTTTYWSTVSGSGTVNVDAQYVWTNTQTFNANISYGNNIALATNTAIYFAGIADANWRIGRNTNGTTKFFYTGNTIDIIAANSATEGIAFGFTGNTYLETGYAGTFTRLPIYVGNSTVNVTINSTSFTGTANNTSFVGSVSAANVVSNAQLSGNLANYQTTAGLSANVATLTANNSAYLGGVVAASYVQNTDSRTLSGNLTFAGSNTTINAVFRVINSTANVFFVAANGNVGVGTNTPDQTLTIQKSDTALTTVVKTVAQITGTAGSLYDFEHYNSTDGNGSAQIRFKKSNGTATSPTIVGANRSTGRFGSMGHDGSAFIENALIRMAVDGTPSTGVMPGKIEFYTSATNAIIERMRIDSSGNVGISNTTPDATLAVTGTANVSGNVRFGSVLTVAANVVLGTTTITANGGVGSAGQVLTSGGAGNVYWTTPQVGDITSVTAGNGLTGGGTTGDVTLDVVAANGITVAADSVAVTEGVGLAVNTTGVHVKANTGIIANSTGTFVNATYIGTLTANDSTYFGGYTWAAPAILGGTTANGASLTYANVSGQVNTATLYAATSANIASIVQANSLGVHVGANVVANTTALKVGNTTLTTTNAVFGGTVAANGGIGSAGQVLTSGGAGNVYWTTPQVGDITSVTAGNGLTGGGTSGDVTLDVVAANGITVAADSVAVTEGVGLAVNTTGVHVKANTGIVANSTGTFVNATYIGTLTANNSAYLGGVAAASYVQNTDSRTLSGNLVLTGSNTTINAVFRVINSTANVLFVGSDGNVGIGETNPLRKLTVRADSVGSITAAGFYNADTTANNGSVFSFRSDTTGTGATTFQEFAAIAGRYEDHNHATRSGSLDFFTVENGTGANRMRVAANGNVGINNATPDATLAITGTANVSGNARFGGVLTVAANVVLGTTTITANGSVGSAGQVLTSGASGNVYWTTPQVGDITSVTAGNGLTGGGTSGDVTLDVGAGNGITVAADAISVTEGVGLAVNTTGVHVKANTGIVANSTGTFVNATYIGTLTANNSAYLGGVAAASYVQNTDSRTLSGNLVISGTYFNPSANTVLLGNSTQRWVISANSGDFSSTVNAVTSVNSALLTVGTAFIANSTGVYHTGTINAASHTVGAALVANSTGVYHTGTVNAAVVSSTNATFTRVTDIYQAAGDIRNNLGNPSVEEKALFHGQFNNKFRFVAPTSQEESTDNVTWTASTRATAAQLGDLMIGEGQGTSFIAIPSGTVGTAGYYRLTWDVYGTVGYIFLNHLYIYSETQALNTTVTIEAFNNATSVWDTIASGSVNNWPGHTSIKHNTIPYNPSTSAGFYGKVRVTFAVPSRGNTNAVYLGGIEWFGGYPAAKRNAESYDRFKNVTFPANVTAGTFTGNLVGNVTGTSNNATYFGGYTWAAPAILGSTTANGASLTYANVSGQVNTATLYATTSANIASIVQANSLGVHVGANVVANTTALKVGNTTLTTTNAVFGGTIAANGGIGTAGQVLTSGAAGNVYWTTPTTGTVTSVASGNGILGGTITSTGTLYVDGANGISVDASGVNVLAGNTQLVSNATGLWIDQTKIDHNLLSNYVADQHVAHSTITLTAGNGLTGGGTIAASRTFDVGAGNGISVAADAVYVNGGSTLTVNTLGAHVNSTLSISTLTTTGNVTVGGNLTVTGNVTVIGANNLSIVDNFLYLNSNNTTQNIDLGFAGNYNDGTYKHAGFFRDATDGFWKVFDGYTPEPDAAVDIDTSNNTFNIAGMWIGNTRIGNTTVYATINSTAYSGTANNSTNFAGYTWGSPAIIGGTAANGASFTYANVSGQVNTATLYATTSANIASAVQANATGVWTTGTVNAASHTVGTAFTANSTVVNAVSYYSGALLVANTTVINATHLVGATWAAPAIIGSSTPNGGSFTYANVSGQVNTATLYASTSANIASIVQANSLGVHVGANVVANTTALRVGNTTLTTTNAVFGGTIAANGGIGSAGQVLTSGAAGNVYWTTPTTGTVTSVASGNGILGGTITSTGTLYVDAANGISVDASGVNVLAGNSQLVSNATGLWINQGQIDHNSLLNYVADRHIAHSGVSITAGAGLTGGGTIDASRTLDVGAGNGITVGADSIAVTEGVGLAVNATGVHVKANTGIVANTTGTFVNAAYIATIASNSATYANASITNTFTVGTASYFVSNGNLGVGTAAPGYRLEVNGSFAATTKSFVIDHPTKSDMKLRYGSLEGPENGVYVRGRTNTGIIDLPDYWTGLIDQDSITVNLTAIGRKQELYVKEIANNKITIAGSRNIDCYYTVFAERKDVVKLVVEF